MKNDRIKIVRYTFNSFSILWRRKLNGLKYQKRMPVFNRSIYKVYIL